MKTQEKVVVVVGLLFVLVFLSSRKPGTDAKAFKAPQAVKSAASASEFETSNKLKQQLQVMLDQAGEIDTEAKEMADFFREYAVSAILMPDGVFVAAETRSFRYTSAPHKADVNNFFVLSATEALRRRLNLFNGWTFNPDNQVLKTPPVEELSWPWSTAFMTHEVRHAYDLCHGIEPYKPSEQEWLAGELRAYQLEMRLIEKYVPNWEKVVDRVVLDPVVANLPKTRFLDSRMLGQIPFLTEAMASFPPCKTETDRNARTASFVVAVNFALVRQRQLGTEGYLRVMKLLHSQE